MNKLELVLHHEKNKEYFLEEHRVLSQMIDIIPDKVDCLAFLGNRNCLFLRNTKTLEELIAQVNQWNELYPTVDSYYMQDDMLCVKFILSSEHFLITYCSDLQRVIDHYLNGKCVIDQQIVTKIDVKCAM